MKRNNFVLRRRTKIAQKLPRDLEEKITRFHRFIIKTRKNSDYRLEHIGNMDETPMTFDMPSNMTVDKLGAKTVMIKTTGHEKTRFTVVLACMADGTKLPPMVIFKRKTMPKEKLPKGVFVHVDEKGWMNEEGMLLWIKKIWAARPGGLLKPKSLLVWDMFKAHLVNKVRWIS